MLCCKKYQRHIALQKISKTHCVAKIIEKFLSHKVFHSVAKIIEKFLSHKVFHSVAKIIENNAPEINAFKNKMFEHKYF